MNGNHSWQPCSKQQSKLEENTRGQLGIEYNKLSKTKTNSKLNVVKLKLWA